ncbi:MAG TPA: pyridoxamine 5'-phosphate oxidase family protein [Candidatus Atribacteria bacterium]|nr:pyridoxamine 5'-phosphate oxidase family protein [Candidatus Atribacteria bacterium]
MRRKEKEILNKKLMISFIEKAIICRVGMCWQDMPYVIPMNFGYRNNNIFLHSASEGRKLDILRNNNKVCIEFDIDVELVQSPKVCKTSMKYKSVLIFGKAVILKDMVEKKQALDIIMHHYNDHNSSSLFHYSEDVLEKVTMVKVKIEEMTGKESKK